MNYYTQTPEEKLAYEQVIAGDTIASAVWEIDPIGPTLSTPINTSTATSVYISGLTASIRYIVSVIITTTSGSIIERVMSIQATTPAAQAGPAPPPEFTYADLLALDAAIKSGANRVRFADREMQYNSLSDMLKARSLMLQYLGTGNINGTSGRRQIRMYTGTGW